MDRQKSKAQVLEPLENTDYCESEKTSLEFLKAPQASAEELYENCDFQAILETHVVKPAPFVLGAANSFYTVMKSSSFQSDAAAKILNPLLRDHYMLEQVESATQQIYDDLNLGKFVENPSLMKTLPIEEQKEIALKLLNRVFQNVEYDHKFEVLGLTQTFYEPGRSDLESEFLVLTKEPYCNENYRVGFGVCHDFAITYEDLCKRIGLNAQYLEIFGRSESLPTKVIGHAAVLLTIGNEKYIIDPTREVLRRDFLAKFEEASSNEEFQKQLDKYYEGLRREFVSYAKSSGGDLAKVDTIIKSLKEETLEFFENGGLLTLDEYKKREGLSKFIFDKTEAKEIATLLTNKATELLKDDFSKAELKQDIEGSEKHPQMPCISTRYFTDQLHMFLSPSNHKEILLNPSALASDRDLKASAHQLSISGYDTRVAFPVKHHHANLTAYKKELEKQRNSKSQTFDQVRLSSGSTVYDNALEQFTCEPRIRDFPKSLGKPTSSQDSIIDLGTIRIFVGGRELTENSSTEDLANKDKKPTKGMFQKAQRSVPKIMTTHKKSVSRI